MYLAPSVEHRNWRLATFGSLLATALWLVGSAAFSVYVSGFGSYNKAWGSLAAVVVMLTWLWLGGVALLLGAEVDAAAPGAARTPRAFRSAPARLATPVRAANPAWSQSFAPPIASAWVSSRP